jgi:outer membrane protein TolC
VYAFSFKKEKFNPLDLKEKVGYVNIAFWSNFNDEYLESYICKAIENNHSVKTASWQVEEYRQQVK